MFFHGFSEWILPRQVTLRPKINTISTEIFLKIRVESGARTLVLPYKAKRTYLHFNDLGNGFSWKMNVRVCETNDSRIYAPLQTMIVEIRSEFANVSPFVTISTKQTN